MKKAFLAGILVILSLFILVGQSGYLKWFPDIILTRPDAAWWDTRMYANFGDVLTALSVIADPTTVYIVREETYDNDGTWPATAEIVFRGEGAITQTAGTLNMWASRINAPERTVFSTTGAGSFDFADGAVVRSSWFDDFDDAVDVTQDDALTLQVDGWETVTSSEVLGSDVVLRFDNVGDFLYLNTGVILSGVSSVEAGRYQVMRGPGRLDFEAGSRLKTSWFERFDEAIRYVDDSAVSLLVDKAETVVANTVTGDGVTLMWESSNILTLASSLSIVGNIEAGAFQIFSGDNVTLDGIAFHKVWSEWWGAMADDEAASAAANTIAVNAALGTGKSVEMLAGTYYLNALDAITVPGQQFYGQGPGVTTLRFSTTEVGISVGVRGAGAYQYGIAIKKMAVREGTSVPAALIRNVEGLGTLIQDICFDNGAATRAVDNYAGYAITVDRCTFDEFTGKGIHLRSDATEVPAFWSTVTMISKCDFTRINGTPAITIDGGATIKIVDTILETLDDTGIYIDLAASERVLFDLLIENCHFEGNPVGSYCLKIVDNNPWKVWALTFLNCTFYASLGITENIDLGDKTNAAFIGCRGYSTRGVTITGGTDNVYLSMINSFDYILSGSMTVTEIWAAQANEQPVPFRVLTGPSVDDDSAFKLSYTRGWMDGPFVHDELHAFPDNDTTPSVEDGNIFKINNSNPTTITAFDDGIEGQVIYVHWEEGQEANTTIDFSGGSLHGNKQYDYKPSTGRGHMICWRHSDKWHCQVDQRYGHISGTTSPVSNPPTSAELTALYGTPADLGNGYRVFVDDNNTANNYLCIVSAGAWATAAFTWAP